MAYKRKRPELPPYVYIFRRAYYCKPYHPGETRRPTIKLCSLDAPVSQVWEAYERLQREDDHGTLRWLLSEYLASPEFTNRKAERTVAEQRRQAEFIIQYSRGKGEIFGTARLKSITPGVIRKYLDARAVEGAPIAGNRERALISAAWSWAYQRDLVKLPNPCKGVARNPEKPRERYVTDSEYAAVYQLAESPAYLRPCMELAYLCRMRKSEVLGVLKADIKLDGLDTRRKKGSRDAITEWSPRLRAAIDMALAAPSTVDSLYLIHDKAGQPIKIDSFNTAWQRLMARAKSQGVAPFTFHDLKPKGVSDFEGDKQAASGHKSMAMVAVYDRKKKQVKPTR